MAQINFAYNNLNYVPGANAGISNASISFVPFLIQDSISLVTANMAIGFQGTGGSSNSLSVSLGLYSLTGSTLTLLNWISGSISVSNGGAFPFGYISMTSTSASSNITPGNYWWGIWASASNDAPTYRAAFTPVPANAFPGGFIGGSMTASTAALPASINTSSLSITGNSAMQEATIILSA